jgi:TP901 family phage tail tape measure protein
MEVARITALVTANTSQFLSGMAQVDASVKATSARMSGLTATVASGSAKMSAIGSTLTRRLTLPLLAIGGASVAMSSKFETSMAKIEGLVGVAGRDVDKMAKEVRRLGPAYGKSANEAAEAMFFITSAGLRGADAQSVLEQSLKGSAIGLGDTAVVADLATSAMNAYGSSVLPASKATDVMTAAVREGKLEAGELSGSMGRVLPLASAMGVSFDQVGAAFAALSRTGTGAAEAATQIRGILASIQKPTKQASDELAKYGLSAGDLRKQIKEKGLLSTLQTLTTTFGDNEEAQTKVFGNIRALSGVMDLMGANAATTEKIFKSLANSTGATDKAFAVLEKTTGYRLSKAFEQMKQSLMEVGDVLAPVVTAIFSAVSRVIQRFQSLPGPIKTASAAVIGFLAVVGPIALIAGKTGTALVGLAKAFGIVKVAATVAAPMAALGPASGVAAAGMARTGAAAGGAAAGMGKFAALAPLALNPLGLLTIAAVGTAAGLIMFGKKTDYAAERQKNLANASKETLLAMSMVSTAFVEQASASDSLRTASDGVAKARKQAADASKAYSEAQASGRGANETEIAYLQRINDLYLKKMQAEQGASAASDNAGASAASLADAFEKTAGASSKQISGLEGTRKSLLAQSAGVNLLGMSTKQKDKIAQQSLQTEAALGTAQRNRVRDLTAGIAAGRAARAEVQRSNATDAEKVVATERINKGIQGLGRELKAAKGVKVDPKIAIAVDQPKKRLAEIRGQLDGIGTKPWNVLMQLKGADKSKADVKGVADVKIPPKTAVVKAEGTDQAKAQISDVVSMLQGFKSKSITLSVTRTENKARGGFAGFANGGVVRGPGGKDKVPAMLTRGEVVLTKRQQSMVDKGTSIRDAIRRTGGAFNKGGWAGGFPSFEKWKKSNKNGTSAQYKKARADFAKDKKREGQDRLRSTAGRFGSVAQSIGSQDISAKFQGGRMSSGQFDIGSMEKMRRAQETANRDFERSFRGTSIAVAQGIGDFAGGSFNDFEEFQRKTNRTWEREWRGTITKIDGSTFTGGLKEFEKNLDAARKKINETYNALTPAEQALKDIDDASRQSDLASGMQEAQKQLEEARKFGDAKAIINAQKQLDAAILAQRRADLEDQAKAEREGNENKREQALTALEENAEVERQQLQDQFEDQRALRDVAFAQARQQLQDQLDAQMQARRDNDAAELAQEQFKQQQEQVLLDQRLARWNALFDKANKRSRSATNQMIRVFADSANRFEHAGRVIPQSLAAGMKSQGPKLAAAARSIAKLIQDYLKLSSPSKKGPLSSLDHWFDAFAPTLLDGMDDKQIRDVLNSFGGSSITGGGMTGGETTINLNVSDQTFAGMSREQADRVASQIQYALDRRVGISL